MTNWYDKAEQELEEDLASGSITIKEYNQCMRDLQAEYREQFTQKDFDHNEHY